MPVRDHMTPNPITVAPDDALEVVVARMVDYRIRALPVLEDDQLLGIITDRDVKMALGPDARHLDLDAIDPRQLQGAVDWFMTLGAHTVTPDDSLADAARALLDLRVGALPVVENGEVVGIISTTDLLRAALPHFA